MKKTILYFFCFISSLARSQTPVSTTENSGINTYRNMFDIAGKPLSLGNLPDIEGYPLLNKNWMTGTVIFRDGRLYAGLLLNLNLYSNELLFLKDSIELVFTDPVKEFSITHIENKLPAQTRFRSGYPASGKRSDNSFYEVLTDGPIVELIKYRSKVVVEIILYGGAVKRIYQQEDNLFAFDVKNKKIQPLPKGIKAVKDFLPDCTALINQFVSNNKLTMKDESNLILLFQYINAETIKKQ